MQRIFFQPTDTTAPLNRGIDFTGNATIKMETETVPGPFPSSTTPSSTPNSISKGLSLTPDIKTSALRLVNDTKQLFIFLY